MTRRTPQEEFLARPFRGRNLLLVPAAALLASSFLFSRGELPGWWFALAVAGVLGLVAWEFVRRRDS